MTRTTLIAALLASSLMTPAAAQDGFDLSAMSQAEKDAFGAAVREYLMENPQVIMDAVAVLEERQAANQAQNDVNLVANNAAQIFEDGFSWIGGNPDGDLTIVEFFDYRCGYCRRAHPEVAELIEKDGNIRLIVKEFPILGEASVLASRFAIATLITQGDDAYAAMHDALATLQGNPSLPVLERVADGLGYDGEAIIAEMNSDEVNRRITQTRALAQALQINGTPSFIFGDQMVRGYVPLAGMQQIVEEVRGDG